MAGVKSEVLSVKLSVEQNALFKRACQDAAMTEADAAREALMTWAKSRGDNALLKSLANEQRLLVDAIADMSERVVNLSERFDACVQINVDADDPIAGKIRESVGGKTEEPALVGAGN